MTCVLIIDDHSIVLEGCRHLLEDIGIGKIFEARSVIAGYRLYRREQPDVVIVDLAMQGQGLGGLDLIRRMRQQDSRLPILVFSMHGDPVIVSRAFEAGATGYLLKDSLPEDMLEAFETVRRGKPYLNHDLAVQVVLLESRNRSNVPADVTPRELQVLALLAEGKSYSEIADNLGVSYKTVVNACSQLKAKLGARNLPELIRMSLEYISSSPGRNGRTELAHHRGQLRG
ncbi:two-component system response regulator [Paramesorhizobium deserti]|uniref:Two-component system response regulator n=1 Tax=Paramesorhizobium deserti TaxID=1494590 RepID=A0A135HPE0_9HYPH|nr:response regulator transcription factor [Paramesorhizobium deserti]KXF75087.1 two-component system response regulator [Paramesorhizobium deserti]